MDYVHDWVDRAQLAIRSMEEVFQGRMGYPPDTNEIELFNDKPSTVELLTQVDQFFGVVDFLSWPDVFNGYFIGPAAMVEPNCTVVGEFADDGGTWRRDVLWIGSDGGGSLFLVEKSTGIIYIAKDAVLERKEIRARSVVPIAGSFYSFLEALLKNVQDFTSGRPVDF